MIMSAVHTTRDTKPLRQDRISMNLTCEFFFSILFHITFSNNINFIYRTGERPEPWRHWSTLLKERKACQCDSVACLFKINRRISESIENGLLPDYFNYSY